jgi:hypothetical protein
MTRLEAMERYLKPFINDQIKRKITDVKKQRLDIIPKEIEEILSVALEKQKKQIWEPAYMSIFHLHSSLMTGTYEYQICLMNGRMYFDDECVSYNWFPAFLYDNLDEERSALSGELKRKFVRIKEYEIDYAVRQLAKEYKKVMEVYLTKMLDGLYQNEVFIKLKKEVPFHFIFGDYMGEIRSILTYEGGSVDEEHFWK